MEKRRWVPSVFIILHFLVNVVSLSFGEFPFGDQVKNVSIKELLISLTISLNLINLLRALGRSLSYTKLSNTFMFNEGHLLNTSEIYENWVLIRLKLTFRILNMPFFLYLIYFFKDYSEFKITW